MPSTVDPKIVHLITLKASKYLGQQKKQGENSRHLTLSRRAKIIKDSTASRRWLSN